MQILVKKEKHFKIGYDLLFWSIVIVGVIMMMMSYPMMKLRYDIWDHVDRIRLLVNDGVLVGIAKKYWYISWAFIFKIFNINDIFAISITIHRVQFIANCAIVYIASKQIFAAMLPLDTQIKQQNQWLSSLALSSVFVWLTAIGTFSFIQQAWIMWYSVNYQITLSFLFLAIALTINVLTVKQSQYAQAGKISGTILLLVLIFLYHAGELAYLIFYLPIFIICFIDKIKLNIKFIFALLIIVILLMYIGNKFYIDQTPALINLLKEQNYTKIVSLIDEKGKWNVLEGGNRYAGNWNELYKLSVYVVILVGGFGLFGFFKAFKINKRVLLFILLSLVFCFAPTYIISAGFLSLVSYDAIVNRYYFASLLFLGIPLAAYLIIIKFESIRHPLTVIVFVLIVIFGVYYFSKLSSQNGAFYQNVQSIITSVKAKKLDIEVSDVELASIREQIRVAELTANPSSYIYCGPYRYVYMVRYTYNKANVLFDRLLNYSLADCESHAKKLGVDVVYIQ